MGKREELAKQEQHLVGGEEATSNVNWDLLPVWASQDTFDHEAAMITASEEQDAAKSDLLRFLISQADEKGFVYPCDELCEALGLEHGSALQVND